MPSVTKWNVVPPCLTSGSRSWWVRTKTGTWKGGSSPHQASAFGSLSHGPAPPLNILRPITTAPMPRVISATISLSGRRRSPPSMPCASRKLFEPEDPFVQAACRPCRAGPRASGRARRCSRRATSRYRASALAWSAPDRSSPVDVGPRTHRRRTAAANAHRCRLGQTAGRSVPPSHAGDDDVEHHIPHRGRADRAGQRLGQDARRLHPRPLAAAEQLGSLGQASSRRPATRRSRRAGRTTPRPSRRPRPIPRSSRARPSGRSPTTSPT